MADRARPSRPTRSATVHRKEWLSPGMVRVWTLLVTGGTTIVFFVRAYGG